MIKLIEMKFYGTDEGVIIDQELANGDKSLVLFEDSDKLETYVMNIIKEMGKVADKLKKGRTWN